MDFQFEEGSPKSPTGHCFIYINNNLGDILTTYVNILPMEIDFKQYIPPAFGEFMENISNEGQQVIMLPPIPEKISSYEWLRSIANLRGADVIKIVTYSNIASKQQLLHSVNEAKDWYHNLYKKFIEDNFEFTNSGILENITYDAESSDVAPSELLKSISEYVGKLNYHENLHNKAAYNEDFLNLSGLLKKSPLIFGLQPLSDLLKQFGKAKNYKLIQLYVERAHGVLYEDYQKVKELDEKISIITKRAEKDKS